MSEMVDRVARAMVEHFRQGNKSAADEAQAVELFKSVARKAIEAMRKPTEDMILAAIDEMDSADEGAGATWAAMIEEALK